MALVLSGAIPSQIPPLLPLYRELPEFLCFYYPANFFRRWLPVGIAVEPRAAVVLDDPDSPDYPGNLVGACIRASIKVRGADVCGPDALGLVATGALYGLNGLMSLVHCNVILGAGGVRQIRPKVASSRVIGSLSLTLSL